MAFTVTEFKSNLFNGTNAGGARPSLFSILINDSEGTYSFGATDNVLVKAAEIPAATIAPLPINYAGRAYKLTGFRTYDNWTTTIINDENFTIRNNIMNWMYRLSGEADGSHFLTFGLPESTGDGTVTQIGVDGTAKGSWKMHNMWPTELSEIALDWSSDAVEEYTVTWAYDFWTKGTTQEETTSIVAWT